MSEHLRAQQVSRRTVLKGLGALGAGLAAPGVLSACGGSSLKKDTSPSGGGGNTAPLKIGLLVPLSGVYAPLGKEMKQGWELYLSQHGGKLGGRTVETVTADEGGGPDTGVPAAQRLVQQDRVAAVVGVVNSAIALGVKDLFTEAKVPLVLSNAGANAVTKPPVSPYLWRVSFSNFQPNFAMGKYVAQVAKGPVYTFASDYAAGREQIAGFLQSFKPANGAVAGQAFSPFGKTQDYQPFLSNAQKANPAACYAFYSGSEAALFLKQYKDFGLAGRIPLFGSGFLTEEDALGPAGAAALTVQTGLHYSTELDNPTNKKFVSDYRSKFGGNPAVFAVQTYDGALLLDKALASTKGDSAGDALSAALGKVGELDSPRGKFSLGEDHNPKQTVYLREVRQQGSQLVNAVLKDLGVVTEQPA